MDGTTGMSKPNITVRPMRIEDLDQVLEVERASFPTPWTKEAFYRELTQNRLACYLVALADGRVIAYAGAWLILDEAHVTNIAVHPSFRGRKVGELLMRSLMLLARSKGARQMTLEVRASNLVAQNLYRKLGFSTQGRRPKYYTDNQEDALIMWADLNICLQDGWMDPFEQGDGDV